MSNGWMKKDSGQEEKISGITQVLLDTTKIRTLKVLRNRSKKWWLFIFSLLFIVSLLCEVFILFIKCHGMDKTG